MCRRGSGTRQIHQDQGVLALSFEGRLRLAVLFIIIILFSSYASPLYIYIYPSWGWLLVWTGQLKAVWEEKNRASGCCLCHRGEWQSGCERTTEQRPRGGTQQCVHNRGYPSLIEVTTCKSPQYSKQSRYKIGWLLFNVMALCREPGGVCRVVPDRVARGKRSSRQGPLCWARVAGVIRCAPCSL